MAVETQESTPVATQTEEKKEVQKEQPSKDKPELHETEGQEIDGADMLSTENLEKYSSEVKDDGKAIEGKDTQGDENAEALKSSPFNSREKLEGGYINSFMQLNPDGKLEDLSKISTKNLVSKYKDLQRDFNKQQTEPEDKKYMEQFVDKEKQKQAKEKQSKIDDPLSDTKVRKNYNMLIQEKVRNNIPYEKAKEEVDRVIGDWQEKQRFKQEVATIKQQRQSDTFEKLKDMATIRINKIKDEDRFKKVPSAEVLDELDKRSVQQGLSELDVVKIINTADKKGNPYMLERLYTDAYNACLLRKNPNMIEEAKKQGEIEANEKIQGGSVGTSGSPDVGKMSKEQKEAQVFYKLQQSLKA